MWQEVVRDSQRQKQMLLFYHGFHAGAKKLSETAEINFPVEDFYVMNGNRALIKREKLERYLDCATAV